jgi:hypothetical protein
MNLRSAAASSLVAAVLALAWLFGINTSASISQLDSRALSGSVELGGSTERGSSPFGVQPYMSAPGFPSYPVYLPIASLGTTFGQGRVENAEAATCDYPLADGMCAFHGDLHSHTFFSDGWGTPELAYQTAITNGMDFLAITDHAFMLTDEEWEILQSVAHTSTVENEFVGLAGYEWTSAQGHIDVFNTRSIVRVTDPDFDQVEELFGWLSEPNQVNTIAQLNHPYRPLDAFNDLELDAAADLHVSLIELQEGQILRGDKYLQALVAGWHVGPTANSDTHVGEWGMRKQRTGIVAPALTPYHLIDAMRSRRTFSTRDKTLVLTLRANGYWMGSVIQSAPTQFEIYAFDSEPDDVIETLELYQNGDLLETVTVDATAHTWRFTLIDPPEPGTWWYVKATQNDNNEAFTSPIWVHQPQPHDIAIRDTMWDMGDVPSADPSWQSPDIWVRHQADGEIWHQNPAAGQTNYVYTRVWNNGSQPITDGAAYFYWVTPSLAAVWPSDWHPINLRPVQIPDLAPGEATTIRTTWDVTTTIPPNVGLYASLTSAQDPVQYPGHAKWSNNAAAKNVYIVDMSGGETLSDQIAFQIGNLYSEGQPADIHFSSDDFPTGGDLAFTPAPALFDRWMASDMGGTVKGAVVDTGAKTIRLSIPVQATVYGLPLEIGEHSTATLTLSAPSTPGFSLRVSERIENQETGVQLITTFPAQTAHKIELQTAANTAVISRSLLITATVVAEGYMPVPDGTEVRFDTTLGILDTDTALTHAGVATTTFVASSLPGTALISASADGVLTATAAVNIYRTCWAQLNDDATDYWTVQAAVDAARSADDVVKVAGHCTVVSDHGDLTQLVHIDKPLTLRGGYTVTNWVSSNPIANPTILDAEGSGRVIYIGGPITVTVEGFRITGGDATGLGGGPSSADAGGGIYVTGGAGLIKSNWIYSNTADVGGGLYLGSGNSSLVNNIISDNSSATEGDGVYIAGSTTDLVHNTIARNGATPGSGTGIFVTDDGSLTSSVTLTNTILVSHSVGLKVTAGNTAAVEATLWGAGVWSNAADWQGPGSVFVGSINIREEPAFSCPGRSSSCSPSSSSQEYHISFSSPARNSGLDLGIESDVDGDPRSDGKPDVGADELHIGLALSKDAVPFRPIAGEPLTYTIRVTNTGDIDLHAIVTDVLPAHIQPGGEAAGTVIVPNGILTWTPTITTPYGVWEQPVVVLVEQDYIGPLTNVVKTATDEGATDIFTRTSATYVKHSIYLPAAMLDYPAPFCAPQLVNKIETGRQSFQVALDEAGRRAFVAHADGVTVISLDSLNVITTTRAATATHGIAYDSVHDRIWVTRKEVNQVVVLDGATYATLTTLPTGAEPHSVAYNPTNDRVYVSNFQGWSVTVYDASAMSRETQLDDFAEPAHIAVNPRTNKIYVANHWAGNHVTVIDGASHSTQRIYTSLIDAYGIAVDTSRNLIYATAIAQGRISIIDGATGTELGHVDIERSNDKKVPLRVIAVNPGLGSKGHLWLVTSSEDGGKDQLLLIPNGWPTLGKPVPLPLDSYPLEGLVVETGRDRIWVTSVSSGLVTVAQDGEPACPSGFSAQIFDAGPFDGEVNARP